MFANAYLGMSYRRRVACLSVTLLPVVVAAMSLLYDNESKHKLMGRSDSRLSAQLLTMCIAPKAVKSPLKSTCVLDKVFDCFRD